MYRKQILLRISILALLTLFFATSAAVAQESEEAPKIHFQFEPDSLVLGVGDTISVSIKLLDENNQVYKMPFLLFGQGRQARRAVAVKPRISGPSGSVVAQVVAHLPGLYRLAARTVTVKREDRKTGDIPVEIAFPPLRRVVLDNPRKNVFVGTTIAYTAKVFDAADLERKGVDLHFRSSMPETASFDAFGNLTAHRTGTVSITAEIEGIRASTNIDIVNNPVSRIELRSNMEEARTGDVVQFRAVARDGLGRPVEEAPIYYSLISKPLEKLGPAPAAEIDARGRFVAETPGYYTVVAHSGLHVSRSTVKIQKREQQKKLELVGHGKVLDVYTSDLWVWEGVDGGDYAVTGTWGASGDAYFWDVTDPANMKTIDTVRVDARTVNDVKVSEDGRIAVISREGASNRRNGIVILDVADPRNVKVLSRFDEQLTGGVHNVFIYDKHVYAVNNSVRYDVINIEDPTKPYRVSRFELGTPGHGVHDVWIQDGIAISSNWQDGVQLVDIGGVTSRSPFRKFGENITPEILNPQLVAGSPSNPFQFASYEYPSGWNHAAFPYYNEETKKYYVLAGDEAFPYGLGITEKKPTMAAGWVHFIDFTDPRQPEEVARYEVPEAGSHNYWVDGDLLYAGFYNGGLRVVDISGDLKGDLYKQGREIDFFLSMDPGSVIPNAPMVWGAMPHKGLIYFADLNSGLWVVKLVDKPKKKEGMP